MKIDRKKLEKLATIKLYCTPEHVSVRGNALASGDDAEDKKAEDWIMSELESGNQWAWCSVEVRASYAGVEGADYLGCCSYKSEEDFRQPGGYFDDMCYAALGELEKELLLAGKALGEVIEPRQGRRMIG